MPTIKVDSPFRSAPLAGTSGRAPEEIPGAGSFARARAAVDGTWLPGWFGRTNAPQQAMRTQPARPIPQSVSPQDLAVASANVSAFFRMFTAHTGAPRNEIPFTFRNGDTAVIAGDSVNQRIVVQTRNGEVREASIGANGPSIVRGFGSPDELNACLLELVMGSGWPNARASQ